MPASIKNILIGFFILTAIGIVVFMLLFLHPTVGDNAKTLRVRFTDIDKVNIGTRVTFAGRPVGEVVLIEEIPDARYARVDQHGDVYVYELTLKVDSSVDIFNSDEVSIRTSGLLGERNIEIDPRPLEEGSKLERVDNQILYATPSGSVETTLKQFKTLSQKLEIVLEDFHRSLDILRREEVMEKVAHSIQNIVDITDSLNQPDVWQKTLNNMVTLSDRINDSWTSADQSLRNFQDLTERAQQSWTTVDQTLANFHETSSQAKAISEQAHALINYTSQGQGTLGGLLVGDDLYLRLKSVLHKGETVMDDVKSYGVLFHLDKRWQRLQARRLNLMDKLANPNEFARYFNKEVDEISASLSRVSMVLNESEYYPCAFQYDPAFTQRFADLLRRVQNMEESLNMYNEQVADQE